MQIINEIFKGFIIVTTLALLSDISVGNMKNMAVKLHQKKLISYSDFTRSLVKKPVKQVKFKSQKY